MNIGQPAEEGLSVGIGASAGGTPSSIDEYIVAISGGEVPQEKAEAEATRPVEPEEEASR